MGIVLVCVCGPHSLQTARAHTHIVKYLTADMPKKEQKREIRVGLGMAHKSLECFEWKRKIKYLVANFEIYMATFFCHFRFVCTLWRPKLILLMARMNGM